MVEPNLDSMDRFSTLPDFIMHHIMSYLSAKEVARTSILSKRWKGLCASFPIFDFYESYVHFVGSDLAHSNITPCYSYPIEIFNERVPKFIEFVDASLSRFCELNLRMQKFRLMMSVLDVHQMSPILDKWIESALKCGVKEIDLTLKTTDDETIFYTLPQILFSDAESLSSLKLHGCKFEEPCYNITTFHSLMRLTLEKVFIEEVMMQKLTGLYCPLLEELSLEACGGFKSIYVSEAYKVKFINIDVFRNVERIVIVAPSLEEFTLYYIWRRLQIEIDMVGCPNLKKLQLFNIPFTDKGFHRFVSHFPLLEYLDVHRSHFIERITISSNVLKRLRMNCCINLAAIDIDTPNLVDFAYIENSIPKFFSINAPMCSWDVDFRNVKFAVIYEYAFDLHTTWFIKLKEFLGASNQIEFLTLQIEPAKNSFNFEEFIKGSPSLPREVGTLQLQIRKPSSNYEAILDGALAICSPTILSVKIDQNSDYNFTEWLYEKLMNKDDNNCCNSRHIKCWQHYLKDFKIEGFIPFDLKNDCEMPLQSIDNLKDVLPKLEVGRLHIRLDWSFSFTS